MGGKRKTQEEFILLSRNKYGELFNYNKLQYVDMKTKVILTCSNGHEFEVSPAVHLRENGKGGCKKCANLEVGNMFKYTQSQWIELAKNKHNNVYSYDKVNYNGSGIKVTITCLIHGDFSQDPASHLNGNGCMYCGIVKSADAKKLTEADIQRKYNELSLIHNNQYTYNQLYNDPTDNKIYLSIKCPKHGDFVQRLDHHLVGHSCVKCVSSNSSKPELEWLAYKEISYGCKIERQHRIGQYFADGFIEPNIVFEFDGDFFHGNPVKFNQEDINTRTGTTFGYLYERTQRKHEFYTTNGYTLVKVWENDWESAIQSLRILQKKFRSKR